MCVRVLAISLPNGNQGRYGAVEEASQNEVVHVLNSVSSDEASKATVGTIAHMLNYDITGKNAEENEARDQMLPN